MDPNVIMAGVAAIILFGLAGIVGWADQRRQRRIDRLNAAIIAGKSKVECVPSTAAPKGVLARLRRVGIGVVTRPAQGRWS
jgi:hypothetical protein